MGRWPKCVSKLLLVPHVEEATPTAADHEEVFSSELGAAS